MTLIFGINLSDRVYLAADTRLTQKKNGQISAVKDRLIKITPLNNDIAVAFAGDANMATYLSKGFLSYVGHDLDIRSLRANIENEVGQLVDEYWRDFDARASVVMIFAGLNRSEKKKELTPKQIYDLGVAISKDNGGQSFNLKPAILDTILKQTGQTSNYSAPSDSHIFSVEVGPPNQILVRDAEWGEFLAYGAGHITKDALDSTTTARLEANAEPSHNNMMINAVLGYVTSQVDVKTIGDTFFTYMLHDEVSGAVLGKISQINPDTMAVEHTTEIVIRDGKPFIRTPSGNYEPLTMLHTYKDFGSLGLEL